MTTTTDRRTALKVRHRAALVAAARELVDERGPAGFTTDDLAARAEVSRRTVFNHFAHLEDVVVACAEAELEEAVVAVGHDLGAGADRVSPLDDLEASLSSPDVADVISRLGRVFTAPGREAVAERVRQQALQQFGAGAAGRLRARYPELEPLEIELLTTTVMNGAAVVAATWLDETGGDLGNPGRARLASLLADLFRLVRHGFGAPLAADRRTAPPVPTPSTEGP